MTHVIYKDEIWFQDNLNGRWLVGSLSMPLIGWQKEEGPIDANFTEYGADPIETDAPKCQYCQDIPWPMHYLTNKRHGIKILVCRSCKNLLLNQEISLTMNHHESGDDGMAPIITSICTTAKGWHCIYGGRRIAKLLVNDVHELSCIVHVNHSYVAPIFFASVLDHKTNKLWTKSVYYPTRNQAQSASLSFALNLWFKYYK